MMLSLAALRALPWKWIGLGLLIAALAIQTVRLDAAKAREEVAKVKLDDCRKQRQADRNAYRAAQERAKQMHEAEVARIETEQEAITDEVESNLNARLERLRRELREQSAVEGPARSGPAGGVPQAPKGADGTARVCLTPDQLLRAAENEERHDQLIEWVERQLGVRR